MTRYLKYSILSLFLICSSAVDAQDTLKQVFRPRLGMGTGVMTYYGEIQNYQKGFSPTVNRFGGMLYINAPISKMFNLEFSATYAKIASNERTLARNYNFESRIRMGSAMVYYNFSPWLQENRTSFHPFIGVGFSSFEFLSKTDLQDANGNQYFFWSDGSIMNMDENNPMASDAVPLTRDYSYETDLRELDFDGIGKYKEQSFAIPLSIGVEWHMSPRWDFRVAATHNFTFTDLIDNISTAGTGIRAGDKKKDRLLFTYVSLSYDLSFGKKEEGEGEFQISEDGLPLFAEWDPSDVDSDGVVDALDKCPDTPVEALVDEDGCPLDSDKDGVPDYRDDEPGTPEGNYVNSFGVTLTESDLEKRARKFNDSTGYEHDFVEYRTEVVMNQARNTTFTDVEKTGASGLTYVVIIGKEKKDVTVNDLHKLLGYKDYSSVVKGDTIYYTLGKFSSIQEAVAAKMGLEENGVATTVGRNSGNNETIFAVNEDIVEKVVKVNTEQGVVNRSYNATGQVYRVQLGAYRNKIDSKTVYPGLDVVYGASEKDNLNRYYSGAMGSYDDAIKHQRELEKQGIVGTFIVAYEEQERVTLIEAGVEKEKLPENYSEAQEFITFVEERDTTAKEIPKGAIDSDQKTYRIRLAYFAGDIPVETVDILYNIQNVKPIKGDDGSTTYYSQEFFSKAERDAAMDSYKAYGLDNLERMTEFKGVFYTDEEYNNQFED